LLYATPGSGKVAIPGKEEIPFSGGRLRVTEEHGLRVGDKYENVDVIPTSGVKRRTSIEVLADGLYVQNGNNELIRLDYVEDNNGKVTILDFKTTEGVDGKKAITRVKSSIQLKIYALAYEKLYGRRPDEIGIYFLENGLVSTIPVTQQAMDEAILAIKVAEAGIRDHNFKANPKEGAFTCQYCSFNRICPESLV